MGTFVIFFFRILFLKKSGKNIKLLLEKGLQWVTGWQWLGGSCVVG
jgi:hypothetical protein